MTNYAAWKVGVRLAKRMNDDDALVSSGHSTINNQHSTITNKTSAVNRAAPGHVKLQTISVDG
ncbi:uncharacterized protein EAF02_002023 [Botrytis sinoallii]|uniref:uncharacterized protein n=1 Tax=Botrytis sinoallii TaxID=1463999 RepID=UPI001901B901|nr:uncharacterized protein EAF02_002023 [Botrytis sinoallii]KAF7889608.1 hypothetical protein EAF02_002023 [Botrytis sinoallii]